MEGLAVAVLCFAFTLTRSQNFVCDNIKEAALFSQSYICKNNLECGSDTVKLPSIGEAGILRQKFLLFIHFSSLCSDLINRFLTYIKFTLN